MKTMSALMSVFLCGMIAAGCSVDTAEPGPEEIAFEGETADQGNVAQTADEPSSEENIAEVRQALSACSNYQSQSTCQYGCQVSQPAGCGWTKPGPNGGGSTAIPSFRCKTGTVTHFQNGKYVYKGSSTFNTCSPSDTCGTSSCY